MNQRNSTGAGEPSVHRAHRAPTDAVAGETDAPFIDRIQPMPIRDGLETDVWGHANVVPRDTDNGIEDPAWCYWGGDVIAGPDGRYHMFVARWPEAAGHGGWVAESEIVRCTATDPLGPFTVEETIADGANGHNPAVIEHDGTYGVFNLYREVAPAADAWDIAVAEDLDGPWRPIQVDIEGRENFDNPAPVVRQDGSILVVNTNPHEIHVAESLTGPYHALGPLSFPEGFEGVEDYTVWREDGRYHMIANQWGRKHGFHMHSPDGLEWTLPERFDAYVPGVTHYEDGTETLWFKMERPQILREDGRATVLYLAALDVPKSSEKPEDEHGSKTVALPLAPTGDGGASGPISEGAYRLQNAATDTVLTVDGEGGTGPVTHRPPSNADRQRWLVTDLGASAYRFESMETGTADTGSQVLSGGTEDSESLGQREWDRGPDQHWRIDRASEGTYRLQSGDERGVLALGDPEVGARLCLEEWADQPRQCWHIQPVRYDR